MAIISKATEANWARLGTIADGRLEQRANKKRSKKTFVPTEYLTSQNTIDVIEAIVTFQKAAGCGIKDIIHTLIILQLKQHGLCDSNGEPLGYIQESIGTNFSIQNELCDLRLPKEHDFIGAVYQSLKCEGQKNAGGLYYTPLEIACEMTNGFAVQRDKCFFDPCCGTGSILLSIDTDDPEALYGCDIDELAILICKVNLFCRFSDRVFKPNIVCADFLREPVFHSIEFSYFATNPPWGADVEDCCYQNCKVVSKESASHFLEKTLNVAPKGAIVSFLLPKALLNIATHKDIRSIILNSARIDTLKHYPNLFTGVTTEFFNIVLTAHTEQNVDACVFKKDETFFVDPHLFLDYESYCFRLLSETDLGIQKKVYARSSYNLSNSIWALGVVTGNNKEKLFDEKKPKSEPIFTGKDIRPFRLSEAKKYIIFDPDQLQQVAKEEIYRAPKKLVYKFVSRKLTFAIDTTGSLCLNSANILIPDIPGLSIGAVAAFLNSSLYQYLYLIMFDDPKILKKNLCKMPFPALDESDVTKLDKLVKAVIQGESSEQVIDAFVFDLFAIDSSERKRVRKVVNGKA